MKATFQAANYYIMLSRANQIVQDAGYDDIYDDKDGESFACEYGTRNITVYDLKAWIAGNKLN
jgi:hypothetical protein